MSDKLAKVPVSLLLAGWRSETRLKATTSHVQSLGTQRPFCDGWRVVADPDWLALLTETGEYLLAPPSPKVLVDHAEAALAMRLPSSLSALYRVSDGLFHVPGQWDVIWPIDELVHRNLLAYEIEGPGRKELVGFGDDGTGDPFCFHREDGEAVYFWSPIAEEVTRLAGDAAEFWSLWETNSLPPH